LAIRVDHLSTTSCLISALNHKTARKGVYFPVRTDLARWEKMRLLAFAAVVELLLPISARSEVPPEIPFRYRDGLIWLKVELAGKKERLNFLLDSGSSVSAIDLHTAHTHGLTLGDRQSVEGVSGQGFGYRVSDFQAMAGGIVLPKSVLAIDLGTVSESCHQHIDGILGADFFRDRIVQIDFKAGEICLLKNCKVNTANCETLPIRMRNGAFCVPLRIAGNPVQWMRLDTGCDSALEWVVTRTEKRRMSGPSIGFSGGSVHYINISARLGKHTFNDIVASILTRQIFPGEDGLLGNGLLSKFCCLTIDERKSRVVFQMAR
jgi:Aspartyl protease